MTPEELRAEFTELSAQNARVDERIREYEAIGYLLPPRKCPWCERIGPHPEMFTCWVRWWAYRSRMR